MPTIQVADKPTLDNVKTSTDKLSNSTYGLEAIRNKTTKESMSEFISVSSTNLYLNNSTPVGSDITILDISNPKGGYYRGLLFEGWDDGNTRWYYFGGGFTSVATYYSQPLFDVKVEIDGNIINLVEKTNNDYNHELFKSASVINTLAPAVSTNYVMNQIYHIPFTSTLKIHIYKKQSRTDVSWYGNVFVKGAVFYYR